MALIPNIEERIIQTLTQEHHSDLEKEKIVFGIKVLLNDFWKVIAVYLIAILLDCFFLTLLTHLVFFTLRQVCLGFHFQNSWICLFGSVLAFPIGIFFVDNLTLNSHVILIASFLATILILLFAPIGTKKRPIFSDKHFQYLRKKLFIRLLVIWLLLLIVNIDLQKTVSYGIILQTVSILTQKLLVVTKVE